MASSELYGYAHSLVSALSHAHALYLLYCDPLISDVHNPHFSTLSTAQGPITTAIFITAS